MLFPFSAIVEQERLKTALMICAVNPSIGGLLITGEKGTAKSTAVRALSELLPSIEKIAGCNFNCRPDSRLEFCSICNTDSQKNIVECSVPFINLPIGTTEDRLLGSLDFEKALKSASKAFQPGLLAAVHRGILYIDEVNLLPDHLVDVLLDVAASGVNHVERESITLNHPSQFTLIGSMNPEEGELRPQFLDRFAMCVEVSSPRESNARAEIVRRRIEFERIPQDFAEAWAPMQAELRSTIARARKLLPEVIVDDESLEAISKICIDMSVSSLRADIFMHKVARVLAALRGSTTVSADDIRDASHLVLPHRSEQQRDGKGKDKLADVLHKNLPQDGQQKGQHNDYPETENYTDEQFQQATESGLPTGPEEEADDRPSGTNRRRDDEQVADASRLVTVSKLETRQEARGGMGKRSTTERSARGMYVRPSKDASSGTIAIDATIKSSIIRNQGRLEVEGDDLFFKARSGKEGNLIVMVVDASGSMSAMKRMQIAKGAALSLLQDAYRFRDRISLIAFGGSKAEVLLPPTRSLSFASQRLHALATGGATPLAHALYLVNELITSHRNSRPLLILMTDGRANVSLHDGSDPWQDVLDQSTAIARLGVPSLVLDTESGQVRLGMSEQLATALKAEFMPVEKLSAGELKKVIRAAARRGSGA